MANFQLLPQQQQILASWIQSESAQINLSELETRLQLSYGRLDWLRLGLAHHLKESEVQAIAEYRGMTPVEVKDWLNLLSS